MAGNILHRRSTTAAATPASLENGQIAINQADGVLFWKDSSGVIQSTTLFPISAASPTLTGTPTAPTATAGTNNTQIATTAYADNAASARQAADATLTAVAGVTTAADTYVYFTGVDTAAAGTITSFGRSLIDDAAASDARTTLELGTANSPQFTGVEIGHATDTTVTRASAGQIAVEGVNVLMNGGALGTPASGTLTNCTGLPVAGITASTSTALGVGSIELGHATDTTLARSSAGNVSIEGNVIYRAGGTDVPLADGGTGASLTDPNADRIMFWDDSAGAVTWLTAGTGLTITGTTIDASGGSAASTTVSGIVELATNTETRTGTDTTRVVTPDGLTYAFENSSLAASGYQFLPGGLCIQWGTKTISNASGTLTFPIAFPTACRSLVLGPQDSVSENVYVTALTTTSCSLVHASGNINVYWMAIGY